MEENILIELLKRGDKEAFSMLFNKYYKDLVLFGGHFLPYKNLCEDIVQNIFLKLWKDRETLLIDTSLKSFLLKSVQNSCLDEIRHKGVVQDYTSYSYLHITNENIDTEHYVLYSDLQDHLTEALKKLPEVCKQAFELSRLEGLKYIEIAEKLSVSERTVEVRIGKALTLLRQYLKEYLVPVFLLLTYWR